MASPFGIIGGLVFAVVGIVVSSLLLWVTTKLLAKTFGIKDTGFKTAFVVALILGIVNYVIGLVLGFVPIIGAFVAGAVGLIVGILLGYYLVKKHYALNTGHAIVVLVVWFVLSWIATAILGAIFAAIFIGTALAAGGASALFG
ncbi:hypothetical protein HY493_00300 [Candidatus Woesearchaeota archaeon]|nr:hypothetical protein [Candidatus Woesearchaeota archaeon]